MSFEFTCPFPVDSAGGPLKAVRALASTPSPIDTDPTDLIIWSGAGATLRAMAAGAIRYVPPTPPATLGALAVESKFVPWPWATLVDASDEFVIVFVPATIYYENTDRTTAEAAIRDAIRAKYGTALPAPEDTMINDFFAGNWVGRATTDASGAAIIEPLTIAAGAVLGRVATGHDVPPDPTTPNDVILKLRNEHGAVDIVEVATAARRQCRADLEWSRGFSELGLAFPLPISIDAPSGQLVLYVNEIGMMLGDLADLLAADHALFQTDPTHYAGDLNHNQLLRDYLAQARTLHDNLTAALADACHPPASFLFDLQTVWYNVLLIDSYRFLHQARLYVAIVLYPQDSHYRGVLDDIDLRMAQFNTALSDIQADPHFAGRAAIVNNVRWVETVVDILRLTALQAVFVRAVGVVMGAISLVQGMIAATGALVNLASTIQTGGGFGTLSLVATGDYAAGSVVLASGGTATLTAVEVAALVQAGVLTARGANLILMSAFNPSGKGVRQADRWVGNNHPNWTKQPVESGRGSRWVDENGIERIRFKKPNARSDSVWSEREKLGQWRLQSKDGHYLDAEGRVLCFRNQQGRLTAIHGRIPRVETPEVVTVGARPNILTNGEPFVEVPSIEEAQRLSHIAASFNQ